MFSVVCVLHSGNGHFSPALCANATSAVTALFHSLSAGAPEFIPNIVVLRADPENGVRFLFSSAVANSNHAVSTASLFACSFPDVPELASGSSPLPGDVSSAGNAADNSVFRAFVARNPSIIAQSIFEGTRPTTATKSETTTQTSRDNTSCADPWACLAGALLTGLCCLNKHELIGVGPTAAGSVATTTSSSWTGLTSEIVHNNNDNGHYAAGTRDDGAIGTASTVRGCVLIFSDCTTPDALSFTAETSFAVAAVMLAKSGLTVSCFGNCVQPNEVGSIVAADPTAGMPASHAFRCGGRTADTKTMPTNTKADELAQTLFRTGSAVGDILYLDDVYGAGQTRLRVLAASLHGICAPFFTLELLGTLLDVADAVEGATSSSSPAPRQTRGEHVAEQYVVRPTMLPMFPTHTSSNDAHNSNTADTQHDDSSSTHHDHPRRGHEGRRKARRVGVDGTPVDACPHRKEDVCLASNEGLGWLCPRCMAVVQRDRGDAVVSVDDTGEGNEHESGAAAQKTCLYCAV